MPGPMCEDCRSEVIGKVRRGRCEKCYRTLIKEMKAAGTYAPVEIRASYRPRSKQDIRLRIFRRVTPGPNGCVVFTGLIDKCGYGRIKISGIGYVGAHREIYKAVVGPIESGLMIDHLCHTTDANCAGGDDCQHRRCVNPYHLEPVTAAENNERGLGVTAANGRKTHCVNGHEFTELNTAWRKPEREGGKRRRVCRACKRERKRLVRQPAA